MNVFKGRYIACDIILSVVAGTANTALVIVSCKRCWPNTTRMLASPSIAGFSVVRL